MTGTQAVPDRGIDATPTAMDVRDHTLGPSKPGAEYQLFAEVLNQSILDLGGPSQRDKDDSVRLLTNEGGEYARHRDWLCTMAGIDPVAFFERVAPIARHAALTPIVKGRPAVRNRKVTLDAMKIETFQ